MKKVVHLITGLNIGGAEMMVYKTALKQLDSHFDPIVVSLLPKGSVGDFLEKEGIKTYYLNFNKGLFSLLNISFKLFKIIRREKPTVINSYMFHADILGRVIGSLTHTPIIISSIRNENIGGKTRETVFKFTDFMIDKATAVSKHVGYSQVKKGTIKEDKLDIIYNGVDLEKIDNELATNTDVNLRSEFNIPSNVKIFITVGRLEPQKNLELLLKCFARLVEVDQKCMLLIVGDGYLKNNLDALTKEYQISNQVIFLGRRNDVFRLLHFSDIFILASSWEGLPNVVLEAMAVKKPVIATNVGGVPEVVFNEKSGYLVNPNSETQLFSAMKKMLSMSESNLNKYGLKGREIVEEKFTIVKTVKKLDGLYDNLIKQKQLK